MALKGHLDQKGGFKVTSVIHPEYPPSNTDVSASKVKRFVLLAGLEIGGAKQPRGINLNVLAHYITDLAGSSDEVNAKELYHVAVADIISTGMDWIILESSTLMELFQKQSRQKTTWAEF